MEARTASRIQIDRPCGRRRAAALAVVGVLGLGAAPAPAPAQSLEKAKIEAGFDLPPVRGAVRTPVGPLRIARNELLAAHFAQRLRFELTLTRDVARGTIRIDLPQRWAADPASGLRPTRVARLRGRARGIDLDASRSLAVLELKDAAKGSTAEVEVVDTGLPAGTYHLPVSYSDDGASRRKVGKLAVRLYAPVRERSGPPADWVDVRAVNVTGDSENESETFITVVPGDNQRVLAGVNTMSTAYSAWLSSDGGTRWTRLTVPATADVAGTANNATLDLCCDPMSTADRAGNIWYGGLSTGAGSRIHVSRIAPGTSSFVNTVGLQARTSGTQDKPMMTIDNEPTSPTHGRLYVVWNEPSGGGINVVVSQCDTRAGGTLQAARCDNADNWTTPVSVTKVTGSYIYADVAVGPDGRAYVTWWDFSSANAIRGATCAPGANCATAAGWSTASTIAVLDSTGGAAIPFACPIIAQPGGRAAPAPQVETDISSASSRGRVYVTWSDLRADSGTTRCADGETPAATHMTWDSFVASATNALPGSASASTVVGRKLLVDGEGDGQASSDDWFPWLAVDQTTGRAYAAFYSTRHDPTRRTTHFYARQVDSADRGLLTKLSAAPSDYSTATCCTFGNDYGDYTGIDATDGVAYAIWSDKSGSDGEAFVAATAPPAPGPAPLLAAGAPSITDPVPGGDGDGTPEPGETLEVSVPVSNDGTGPATAVTGTLSSSEAKVTFPRAGASYGTVAAAASSGPDAPYRVKMDKTLPCGQTLPLRIDVAHSGGATTQRSYAVDTGTSAVDASSDVPKTIPDNATGGVSSTITLPAGGTVGDLDVGVSLTHTWVGDLQIRLRAPDGTQVTLFGLRGGNGDNLSATIFDDEAATAISAGSAPFSGRFRPEQPLSALDGIAAGGTWTLTVVDTARGDSGTLTAWSLRQGSCAVAPRATLDGPATAEAGDSVTFEAGASSDLDGSIARYRWDLDGDGSLETDTGATPRATTTYDAGGNRTVKVEVTDDDGLTAQATKAIAVAAASPPNVTPTAALTAPGTAMTGQVIELDASGSTDSDGTIAKYQWDLDGDGSFETTSAPLIDATQTTSFATPGTKTVRVRVTDEDGATAEATRDVVVSAPPANQAPTAVIAGPTSAVAGEAVDFDASGSSDPDGSIAGYEWDLDSDGSFETTTVVATASTTFTGAGTYVVKLRVTDDDGAVATATTTISVSAGSESGSGSGTNAGSETGTTSEPGADTETSGGSGTGAGPATGGETPAPSGTATVTPPLPFVNLATQGSVRPRRGMLRLAIAGCAGCRGTIVLESAGKLRRSTGARAAVVRLGRASFDLGGTGAATVALRLSRRERALVRRLRRIGAVARLAVADASGARATATVRITLKR